jgi:hypothetical protein
MLQLWTVDLAVSGKDKTSTSSQTILTPENAPSSPMKAAA